MCHGVLRRCELEYERREAQVFQLLELPRRHFGKFRPRVPSDHLQGESPRVS
jgi:hypothetical protein